MTSASFTIVIPTYRRAAMLARTLPSALATEAAEVVVVDDGSAPADIAAIHDLAESDRRIRLLALDGHVGLPAARNAGVQAAGSEWIVFGEDDVWLPAGYPGTLIDHAVAEGARIACGRVPLVHPSKLDGSPEELDAAIERSGVTGYPSDRFLGTPWPVDTLPGGDVLTPLLAATAAIQRSVFDVVRFDPGFRGNAFREETDFFMSCAEAGIRSIHCPHAACGHMKEHARATRGGSWTMSRPRYAHQMASNNWRLLRKHRGLIREARAQAGMGGGPLRMQGEFLLSMLGRLRPARP